jgi:hypothetical protein
MGGAGGSTSRVRRVLGGRTSRPGPCAGGEGRHAQTGAAGPLTRATATRPTILIAGLVRHQEVLERIGQVRRAGWNLGGPGAAGADLVVVGQASPGVDAVTVIAGLRDRARWGTVPVVHVAPTEAPCAACRADVCLSSGSAPGQLARVADVLLELGRRARTARGAWLEPRAQQVRSLGAQL